MSAHGVCPRCSGVLKAPDLFSSAWRCEGHGDVHPLHLAATPSERALAHITQSSRVPVWAPWPLPTGWMVTGVGHCGDERTGATASVVAVSGPSPVGGLADMVLVAEEVGVGLGARYAGLSTPHPGVDTDGPPEAKLEAAGHPTPMWLAESPDDRAVLVGEARGLWLWAVMWPGQASLLLMEHLQLADLTEVPHVSEALPFGAPCPRLLGPTPD